MIVYISGGTAFRKPSFSIYVCPASDMRKADCPSEWLDEAGKPFNMEIEFKFGRAEVPSNLGEYLVRQGLASRSPLIIPPAVKVA